MKPTGYWFSIVTILGGLAAGCAHAEPAPAQPAATPAPATPAPQVQITQPTQPASIESFVAFDADTKEVTVTNGTPEAHFAFSITNISSGTVTVNFVQTSCGCTVAKLPAQPWVLGPNSNGLIQATMNLSGTPPGGTKTKTLTVNTDKGNKTLIAKSTVLPAQAPGSMSEADRMSNQKLAMGDRQAVFKGDCAKCHVEPAKGKMGKDLFTASCGVCHEAEHRASFVADLHHLNEPTTPEFWKNWIEHGKPGSLMPAFAESEGGPLNETQIASLVAYLNDAFPPHTAQNSIPTRTAIH
jgi:mono/diheme cytochrome c family protein